MTRARAFVVVVAPFAIAVLAARSEARADAQISVRLGSGAGAALSETSATRELDDAFVFELAVRSEALFGEDVHDAVRVGPAIDLRTGTFESFEAALGATLLLPVASGWPLWITAGVGGRARAEDDHAAFALGTIAFGYRPYNYLSHYAYGLALYASGRADLDETPRYELTVGLEIDLELLVAIPVMFVVTWLGGGDPDEPR